MEFSKEQSALDFNKATPHSINKILITLTFYFIFIILELHYIRTKYTFTSYYLLSRSLKCWTSKMFRIIKFKITMINGLLKDPALPKLPLYIPGFLFLVIKQQRNVVRLTYFLHIVSNAFKSILL